MKGIIYAILFSVITNYSFSQGMYGAQMGVGYATAYKSYYTPFFEGYYLAKLSPHIYVGGSLSEQRYSFLYDLNQGSNLSYGDIISIRQRSSYVYFKAKIDLGIGPRKYVHFNFSCGPGLFLSGNKTTENYEPLVSPTGTYTGADTLSYNIKYNMRTVLVEYTFGVWERIPTHGYFNITLSQEFSYVSGKLNYPGIDLKSNYFLFTVGLMRKYPRVFVEY